MTGKRHSAIVSPHLPKCIAVRQVGGVKGDAMITCQLSTLMGARRLSQRRLAQLVGVHRNTIAKLYADNWTSIRRDTLDRICTVLQVSVGELLVWHNERRSS
jgi:putative transcriptional regulator